MSFGCNYYFERCAKPELRPERKTDPEVLLTVTCEWTGRHSETVLLGCTPFTLREAGLGWRNNVRHINALLREAQRKLRMLQSSPVWFGQDIPGVNGTGAESF